MLPIVLAPGYFGFKELGPFSYFRNAMQLLQGMGAMVYALDIAPRGGLAERSAQLAEQIAKYGKVHVVAHSMGGLDARYLISHGNGANLIASLTTLGAPFRGTPAADVFANPGMLKQIGVVKLSMAAVGFGAKVAMLAPSSFLPNAEFALEAFEGAVAKIPFGDYSAILPYFKQVLSLDDAALPELTTQNCAKTFPVDESDMNGVPCWSYAGNVAGILPAALFAPSTIVLNALGESHDGVVPLESARLKNHRATLPVDHLGLMGWGATSLAETYREIYANLPK